MLHPVQGAQGLRLLRILQAANGGLRLAFGLVAFAVSLKLGVTECLVGDFLDGVPPALL
jgi:hypothetical protein